MMNFLDLARLRFSARKYKTDPVPQKALDYILECGRIAPSAANYQPWYFIVIRDEKLRLQMKEVYDREWFYTAPVHIVVCGDHNQSWKRSDGKDHCDIDVAIAADHMTLAAADQGLGTCWICNFDKVRLKMLFNMPFHIEPCIILSLGYPEAEADPKRHATKRKPPEEIIYYEVFQQNELR